MKIRENVPISELTTMRIGGAARYVIDIETIEDVRQAYIFARQHAGGKTYILGGGANTIGRDEGYDGVILVNKLSGYEFEGLNKIAYAHHKDDVVDTMMLSLMYEGRFQTLEPRTYWDKSGLTLIRPLIYVKESEIKGFVNKQNLPIVKNICPADGFTKRQYVNDLLRNLNIENPGVKDRMFTAVRDTLYKDFKV